MKKLFKRLYYSIFSSKKVILLDYPAETKPVYTKEHPHKKLFDLVKQNDNSYTQLLKYALSFKNNLSSIQESGIEKDEKQPTWNNEYVPGLDIIILYTLLNQLKPRKYIEIGSGTSTKTAQKARMDQQLDFIITCIDPHPRQEIKSIADEWRPNQLQAESLEVFKTLSENDVVFFDGTHTLYPNSDVAWFFLEVLPVLSKGVVVQVHDIYIPYDYPQFMCDRFYSENYILAAMLLNNPDRYEIIAPNFYISEQPQLSSILDDIWDSKNLQGVEKHGGSFWFKIK